MPPMGTDPNGSAGWAAEAAASPTGRASGGGWHGDDCSVTKVMARRRGRKFHPAKSRAALTRGKGPNQGPQGVHMDPNFKRALLEARRELRPLLNALRFVESSNRVNVPDGDMGMSIGPLQISEEYHRDAWRHRSPAWTRCRELEHAEQTVVSYWLKYCPDAVLTHDWEALAKTHNGGPNGPNTDKTLYYWSKVLRTLKEQQISIPSNATSIPPRRPPHFARYAVGARHDPDREAVHRAGSQTTLLLGNNDEGQPAPPLPMRKAASAAALLPPGRPEGFEFPYRVEAGDDFYERAPAAALRSQRHENRYEEEEKRARKRQSAPDAAKLTATARADALRLSAKGLLANHEDDGANLAASESGSLAASEAWTEASELGAGDGPPPAGGGALPPIALGIGFLGGEDGFAPLPGMGAPAPAENVFLPAATEVCDPQAATAGGGTARQVAEGEERPRAVLGADASSGEEEESRPLGNRSRDEDGSWLCRRPPPPVPDVPPASGSPRHGKAAANGGGVSPRAQALRATRQCRASVLSIATGGGSDADDDNSDGGAAPKLLPAGGEESGPSPAEQPAGGSPPPRSRCAPWLAASPRGWFSFRDGSDEGGTTAGPGQGGTPMRWDSWARSPGSPGGWFSRRAKRGGGGLRGDKPPGGEPAGAGTASRPVGSESDTSDKKSDALHGRPGSRPAALAQPGGATAGAASGAAEEAPPGTGGGREAGDTAQAAPSLNELLRLWEEGGVDLRVRAATYLGLEAKAREAGSEAIPPKLLEGEIGFAKDSVRAAACGDVPAGPAPSQQRDSILRKLAAELSPEQQEELCAKWRVPQQGPHPPSLRALVFSIMWREPLRCAESARLVCEYL